MLRGRVRLAARQSVRVRVGLRQPYFGTPRSTMIGRATRLWMPATRRSAVATADDPAGRFYAGDECDDAGLHRPEPYTGTAPITHRGREGRAMLRRSIRALVLVLSVAAAAGCEYIRLQPH